LGGNSPSGEVSYLYERPAAKGPVEVNPWKRHPGKSINNMITGEAPRNLEEAKKRCIDLLPECVGISCNNQEKGCLPQKAATMQDSGSNEVAYLIEDWVEMPGYYLQGNIGDNIPLQKDCKQKCANTPECVGCTCNKENQHCTMRRGGPVKKSPSGEISYGKVPKYKLWEASSGEFDRYPGYFNMDSLSGWMTLVEAKTQ
jgi:hypothetical protein